MINTSEEKTRSKTAKEAEARSKQRAEQAQIVSGLQELLEADEQLLGFTRGLIAGGLRGKLTVGFEALFAPYVNIGLTERRIVLQHVQPESGKPNDILPHSFPLSELQSVSFSDIETFGGEPAGRLNLRLFNDQHFRLRFQGIANVENAQSISEVFGSLTSTRQKARTSPTQSLCPHCDQVLDRVSRFCPYCGNTLESMDLPMKTAATVAQPDVPVAAEAQPTAEAGDEPQSAAAVEDCSVAEDVSQNAETTSGSETDEHVGEDMHGRPSRTWASETPPSENIVDEGHPEGTTEGHETPAATPPHDSVEVEGDRPQ